MKYIHKDRGNRQIHVGLVARCNRDEQYGLLYGFREAPRIGRNKRLENKMFFFFKEKHLEIADNTLVSYLSIDYDDFTPKVDYVYPISSLVRLRDRRGTQRADNVYHDDRTWQLITEGKPYFDYECGRNYCIYYPTIENDTCTIWQGLFGCGIYMQKEAEILELNNELNSMNYTGWPTLEEVTNAVIEFKKQIDSINANEIIDTFQIMIIGRYISRPGRDDHFYKDLYQTLPYDDKYLSYLLPTKQERIFFDSDAYPSDGYETGVELQTEETLQAREKAKNEYSKDKHLAFLINDFFSEVREKKERKDSLIKKIQKEFDVANASEVVSKFKGELTEEFIALLNKYNESTEIR